MSESRRPAVHTVSRGLVKNRSRKESSVSSLPSVRSTASWLIPHLPQTDLASGRPDLPIRHNWAMRERSWRTRPARRVADWCGATRPLYHRIQTVSNDTVTDTPLTEWETTGGREGTGPRSRVVRAPEGSPPPHPDSRRLTAWEHQAGTPRRTGAAAG